MQGRKNYSEKLFVSFQLSDRVPKENFYRRLNETIDLQFIYRATEDLYGRTGNPSIDPVVFFKLMLTGYLENITSDRRLIDHCAMRMDILYFIGYDIDETLPWHSTVSRTRQLYPASLFESLFNKVFSMCVDKGMVAGHTQAIDSAPVKANASMESLELKVPTNSIKTHLTLVADNDPDVKSGQSSPAPTITAEPYQLRQLKRYQDKLKDKRTFGIASNHEKAELLSNKTHYSPHDPDARISIKPGKLRKLNYHCSMAVDTAEGVISHIQASYADKRDSQCLPGLVSALQDRFTKNELKVTDVVADAGYSNGYNYHFLEQRDLTGWIPVFGMFKPEVTGFTYDRKADSFTCSAGKLLPVRATEYNSEGKRLKAYWASRKDCKPCPLKSTCCPNTGSRRIVRTAYDNEYHRAYNRQHSYTGKRMKKIRQGTVEPVFGSLTQYYGLSKIAVLGIDGAHKNMVMAAIAFNIRKYMKFSTTKTAQKTPQRARIGFSGTICGHARVAVPNF